MDQSRTARRGLIGAIARRIFAVFLVVVAAMLLWLGGQLAALGGSVYYLFAGVVVLVSAAALWMGRRSAAPIYWVFLAITWAWALWETSGDPWAMVARVGGPTVIGLLFIVPFIAGRQRKVRPHGDNTGTPARVAVTAALVLVSVSLGVTLLGYHAIAQVPALAGDPEGIDEGDWPEWGNDKGGQRFSALSQITPANVGNLKKVWEFRADYNPGGIRGQFEATPIKIRDTLFFCTPDNDIIALDATSGKQRWRFKSNPDMEQVTFLTCRGVSYYRDTKVGQGDICAEKIIGTTIDARLLALDFSTGQLCPEFGKQGFVDLKKGMGLPGPAYYYVTSAPAIVRDRIVFGGFVPDNQRIGGPSGVIRAFSAHDGSFAWAFDAGRPGMHGEPGPGETYTQDTPNSWAPISADESLGLVYLPTGNSTTDWYGGERRTFDDAISSSVVALDAETGALRWSFQTTHHDIWDYDVPSQPTLVDFPLNGKRVPALIQPTKRGQTFVLDRRTGKPLLPVEERAVPQTTVPGERTSPTQPFSIAMPDLQGPDLTEKMMWGLTPIDQAWCRLEFKKSVYEGQMTPVAINQPTLIYPGYNGGNDWGSMSVDPQRDILIAPTLRMALRSYLIPRKEADSLGIRPMSEAVHGDPGGVGAQAGTPYAVSIKVFLSPLGVPCQQPPWGLLNAIDLKTGEMKWSRPLGLAQDAGPWGIRSHLPFTIGTPNAGGAMVTASGLTFVGASQDSNFHAFDTVTGELLWKDKLPAGGNAVPMTYTVGGKQYVVIAAGGHALVGSKPGDSIVAYALP